MLVHKLSSDIDIKMYLKALGTDSGGISILSAKAKTHLVEIKELHVGAANILKQDALSIGADLAVPKNCVTCRDEFVDAILLVSDSQLEELSKKERLQPFGLKDLSRDLCNFISHKRKRVQIMGVLNANDDSFFEGSRFVSGEAVIQIKRMIEDGADIIDVGAVSSRPGAAVVSAKEELDRIKPICDAIKSQKLYEKAIFSVDSYEPSVVEYALESGFTLINDITGASDNRIIKLALKHDAKLCIMHMQGTPQTMQKNPHYEDVMVEVSDFFEERIAKCEALGMRRENIILDVGIGFGKTLEHNLTLLKNMNHFTYFGCEVLIGASRKSMISKIIPTPTGERLPGTLAIHLKAVENGATIVRCHDVSEHKQALAVLDAMR